MKRTAPWRSLSGLAGLAAVIGMLPMPAQAITPPAVPDTLLGQQPIIVVARWPKAKVTAHNHVEGQVVNAAEAHTELLVERVIKGNIRRGRHKLMIGWGVGWNKDGSGLGWYTATQVTGDAENVTRPGIWFLSRKRSWDKADRALYLSLDTYRGVQPLELEPYFKVLADHDRNRKIAGLLSSRSQLIVQRSLTYLNGGTQPWPYRSHFDDIFGAKPDPAKRLVQHAPAVGKLLDRHDFALRPLAAAVYGALAGKRGVPRMRQLLSDRDAEIRAIAVGVLAQQHDSESADRMPKAVAGLRDPHLGCAVVEALAAWRDKLAVPTLITFLQTDSYAGQIGDDIFIPALKAQAALKQITGFSFPSDVQASQRAWTQARVESNATQQGNILAALLGDPHPLSVSAVEVGKEVAVTVTNRSRSPVVLTRDPPGIQYPIEQGLDGGVSEPEIGKNDFTSIRPGEAIHFRIQASSWWSSTSPATRRITLVYTRIGNEFGVHAWVGRLSATVRRDLTPPKGATALDAATK